MPYVIEKLLVKLGNESTGEDDDIMHEDELINKVFDDYDEAKAVYDEVGK